MNDISPIIEHEETALAPQPVFLPLASTACAQVCGALAIAQGEFKTPKRTKPATIEGKTRDGRSYSYKYMYAPLEEIIDAVKEALAKNGLARHQYLVTRGNQPVMRTIIWHASGEWIASDYPIHPTKEGAQGFASGVTYARRYGLSLALGLAPEDDDDGNVADNTGNQVQDSRPAVGKPTNGTSKVKPLPTPPPKAASNFNEVYNPETGEIEGVKPQPIRFEGDWIEWGRRFVAEVTGTRNRATAEAWITQNQDNLDACEKGHANVFKRISANIGTMRDKLPWPAEPQFMEAQ